MMMIPAAKFYRNGETAIFQVARNVEFSWWEILLSKRRHCKCDGIFPSRTSTIVKVTNLNLNCKKASLLWVYSNKVPLNILMSVIILFWNILLITEISKWTLTFLFSFNISMNDIPSGRAHYVLFWIINCDVQLVSNSE